ncbi:MAG: SDR family oxidoreductase, partial [Cytophagaceae bacterium]
MPTLRRLESKVAIVTGGGTGIGEAIAHKFAQEGARVVVNGLAGDPVLDVVQAIVANGGRAVPFIADIAEPENARKCVQTAIDTFGQLDILIHNAGWVGYQPIEEADATFIGRAVDINIYTPVWLCKFAWKYLKHSTAARVVLTSSDRAMYQHYAQPGLVAYAAAKMAQLGIMNALSMEGAPVGILVNAVSPVAKTRMWGVTEEPENLKPEWVAPGVVFLASQQCNDTGYVLRASNGQFTATRFVENPGVDYP